MVADSFTTVLWYVSPIPLQTLCIDDETEHSLRTARMSILYSVIRIIPLMMSLRRVARFCAVLFGCMWAALLIQKSYICGHDRAWELEKAPQCRLGLSVGILELVSKYSIPYHTR
jgi:hypothetical protein